MHPVIQLTVAVAMVVIASRMWPPLLFWLAGFFLILAAIKGARRSISWLRKAIPTAGFSSLVKVLLGCAAWLAVAAMADYFIPGRISAMSIVLCFMAAWLAITFVLVLAGLCRRRPRH